MKNIFNYTEKNLLDGEVIVFRTSYHWIKYVCLKTIFTLFLYPYIQKRTDEFVVTNKRVIVKTGLFALDALEINFQNIETVLVHQSFIGGLLDYGTITISGAGGTFRTIRKIAKPLEFRKKFQNQI